VLTLPLELETAFRDDLETYEREKNMPYISAIERMGEARGKVNPIVLLLVYRVGKFQWKLLKKLKNYRSRSVAASKSSSWIDSL
jgi:hypothetical protein